MSVEASNAATAAATPLWDGSAPAAETNGPEAANETDTSVTVDATVPTAPDGGWGWMVVLGSFVMHVIVYGIMYSFGVFVEDFVDYFECSKSAVGGLGSLMFGVTWSSGNADLTYYSER